MSVSSKLEELIRTTVVLGSRSRTGFETCKCAKCNDYKARGGFKFEPGSIFYSCFNCGLRCGYEDGAHISGTFKSLLVQFGVDGNAIMRAVGLGLLSKDGQAPRERQPVNVQTEPIELPPKSVLVTSGESPWCEVAVEYLKSRALDPAAFPYYVSDDEKLAGRVIIPYLLRSRVIYWQARAMIDTIEPRYKNPIVEKTGVFFNMDELYRNTNDPIFVTEGPIDALSIGPLAVALCGSSVNDFKWNELKKVARRRKTIFVIDKDKNGMKLGTRALSEEGMYVTCLPHNVDDANHGLIRFGSLWLAAYLSSSAVNGFSGHLIMKVHCK